MFCFSAFIHWPNPIGLTLESFVQLCAFNMNKHYKGFLFNLLLLRIFVSYRTKLVFA